MPSQQLSLDRPARHSASTTDTEETAIVTLVAARLEADNTLQLAVRCPLEPVETSLVSFPETAGPRTQQARWRFLDAVCRPSFEGWTLLYGRARLTVTRPSAESAACPQRRALDFEPIDPEYGEPA